MSKRMFDTAIIQQKWYMDLSPRRKALWWQIYAMMDNAGVFEINERMIEVMLGDKATKETIFGSFGNRVQPIPGHPDKGIVVGYIGWSNSNGLSKSSPSQRSVLTRIEELGLSVAKINAMSNRRIEVVPDEDCFESDDDEDEDEEVVEKPVPKPRFAKPSIEDVAAYIEEMGYKVDVQKWYDYYSSNGWRVGRNPMKDWKAAVRTWTRNDYATGGTDGKAKGRRHATNWRDSELTPTDQSVL